jgi:hypothetical protein
VDYHTLLFISSSNWIALFWWPSQKHGGTDAIGQANDDMEISVDKG